ncbi:MAG: hypothetical protein EBV45_15915 [Chloroflexi bacterium]|nr:hypothetical protein [Chloroflexota bacterium]
MSVAKCTGPAGVGASSRNATAGVPGASPAASGRTNVPADVVEASRDEPDAWCDGVGWAKRSVLPSGGTGRGGYSEVMPHGATTRGMSGGAYRKSLMRRDE